MIEDLLKRQYSRKIRQLHSNEKEQIRERIRCLENTIEVLDHALKYGMLPHARLPHSVHYGSREQLSSNSASSKIKMENNHENCIHSTSEMKDRCPPVNNTARYQDINALSVDNIIVEEEEGSKLVICHENNEKAVQQVNCDSSHVHNSYVLSPEHTSTISDETSRSQSSVSETSNNKIVSSSSQHFRTENGKWYWGKVNVDKE